MTLTADRPTSADPAATDFVAARRAMIDSQLRVSGVNEEWVLSAMGKAPREDFVPAAARGHAYIDRAIPLDDGHALPAPLVHGRMLGEAAPTAQDTVLIVSCGSDYLAALVRPLAGAVTVVSAADAAAGQVRGDYSLLLVDGAVEQLPAALTDCLVDAGRVVTGLVERGVTRLAAGRKLSGSVALLPLAEIGIPVLAEFAAPKRWSF
ncbi:protein-L-isoaspartate O-methyltransferase [Novosphingobium sp.]|uniref:protein-L-isoaspartate O-methyltransferase family protein n=1 Tax=Novosphingobium sp. TaxID=1874826 RepID=UPI00273393ED|nr:protein-L-isoaspartate O-methyltransferase [Novosphingobium sp.]MDP3906289.1 protein-L-isoaspartate O-methyltransferase [Novosphingobium sp.]